MSSLPYVKGAQKRIATNKQQRNTHDAHMSGENDLFLTNNQRMEKATKKKEMKLQKRLQEELQIKMQKEKELEKQKTTLPYINITYQPQSTSLKGKYQKGRRTSISSDLQTAQDIQNERLQEQRKQKMEKYDKTLKKDKLDYKGDGYLRKKTVDIAPTLTGSFIDGLLNWFF